MKNILFALSFLALLLCSQTVEAQSQNVYRYNYQVDSLAAGAFHYQEVPATLLSLWTLGGSFSVTNLGSLADDFAVSVYGTSNPTANANDSDFAKWQAIKTVSISSLAAGATSHQHFRAANEMFYLGHTRLMIRFAAQADEPGSLDVNLVLKKE